MRSLIRVLPFLGLCLFLGVSGCQKLNVEKSYKMNPGEVQILVVDAPSRDQDVAVAITSSGSVDVYIAKEADANEANDKIVPPKNPIASKQKVEGKDTLSAKVPAKTAYGVVLLNAQKKNTDVTVKLTGK
jgi:hypothetical protein